MQDNESVLPVRKRVGSDFQVKVGIVGSQSGAVQAGQAVASTLIPGNLSPLRSPLKSTLFSALTPGTVNIRGIPRPGNGVSRCPAGFQHGGRFTNNQFSTCGAQLFDIPGPLAIASALIRGVRNASSGRAQAENISEVVTGGQTSGVSAQISRMAQVPKSGAFNAKKVAEVVKSSINTLTGAPSGEARLVRKDGYLLKPIVPSSVLRNFGGNPDMQDGVFLRSIQKPSDIIGDDLALLSGPAIQQITYVAPNGSQISIQRQRVLTTGEKRKFGRQLNAAAAASSSLDVGNTIREFANNSGGAFKYTEKFPNIESPLDLINVTDDNKKNIQVRRWVYETFMKNGKGKPRGSSTMRESATLREDGAAASDSPSSVQEAIEYIKNGGDPFDVPQEFLAQALSATDMYEQENLNTGVIKFSKGDGNAIYQVAETVKNGSIAERIYSDIASQLGLQTAPARFIKTPKGRSTVLGDAVPDGYKLDLNALLKDVDHGDLLRIAMSDFVSDKRGRSPATITPVRSGAKLTVVPTSNELSLGAGLTSAEINVRYKLDLPSYLTARETATYKKAYDGISEEARKVLSRLYDNILNRAEKFKWDEYISRLTADGELSPAEKSHILIVRKIYDNRLKALKSNKSQFLSLLGI